MKEPIQKWYENFYTVEGDDHRFSSLSDAQAYKRERAREIEDVFESRAMRRANVYSHSVTRV